MWVTRLEDLRGIMTLKLCFLLDISKWKHKLMGLVDCNATINGKIYNLFDVFIIKEQLKYQSNHCTSYTSHRDFFFQI